MLCLKVLGFNYIKDLSYRLFHKSDSYLLIEVLNHYVQLTVLKVDSNRKKILVVKSFFKPVSDFSSISIVKELKSLLKKIRNPKSYKIILSLDSKLGTTIHSSVSLVRQNSKTVIDEADIDNLISQAIWRFFDRQRLKVAQKMDIDDVDVLLSDVRIRGIRLDGHRVVNPIGFKSKSVEIFFSQTFIVREFMRGLRDLLPKDNLVLITETGTAISHILSKILGKDQFFLANLFPDQTSIYLASSNRLSHLDNFEWGENQLTHLLGRHFRLDSETAKSVIDNYIADNASQNFLRRFEGILTKELQIFVNGLESLVGEENKSSDIYLNSFFNLPPVVFSSRFQNRFQKSIKLLPLSTNLITEKLGYEVQFKKSVSVKNPLSLLAAFFEINFLPQNDKMSHLANRRVRWLVT
ncbi:MAG: hypothetical protein Q7S73_00770 [bacterium]|nr:hypothetical protein [bacterium]